MRNQTKSVWAACRVPKNGRTMPMLLQRRFWRQPTPFLLKVVLIGRAQQRRT